MIKIIGNTSAAGTANTVTTSSLDTTGANLVIVACSYQVSSGASLTDNKSNTWTALTESAYSANVAVKLYYCINPVVGSGHTFTLSGTTVYPSIGVLALSGMLNANVFDVENGANNGTAKSTIATGSITPTLDDELLVTVLGFNNSGTPLSIDNSFTVLESQNFLASNHYGLGLAYKVQTSASAINPTWTRTGTGRNATRIASFKVNRGGFFI